jgi:hypothetical protein
MICLLPHWFRAFLLRREHRRAMGKMKVIESMDLPEDLKLAAKSRVMRGLEETLARFT